MNEKTWLKDMLKDAKTAKQEWPDWAKVELLDMSTLEIHPNCTLPDGTPVASITHGNLFTKFLCHCEGDNRESNARAIVLALQSHQILIDVCKETLNWIGSGSRCPNLHSQLTWALSKATQTEFEGRQRVAP